MASAATRPAFAQFLRAVRRRNTPPNTTRWGSVEPDASKMPANGGSPQCAYGGGRNVAFLAALGPGQVVDQGRRLLVVPRNIVLEFRRE